MGLIEVKFVNALSNFVWTYRAFLYLDVKGLSVVTHLGKIFDLKPNLIGKSCYL